MRLAVTVQRHRQSRNLMDQLTGVGARDAYTSKKAFTKSVICLAGKVKRHGGRSVNPAKPVRTFQKLEKLINLTFPS